MSRITLRELRILRTVGGKPAGSGSTPVASGTRGGLAAQLWGSRFSEWLGRWLCPLRSGNERQQRPSEGNSAPRYAPAEAVGGHCLFDTKFRNRVSQSH